MITTLVDLRLYRIAASYLSTLASEYGGKELVASTSSEHLTEYAFDGPQAASNAKAFRTALDTSFRPQPKGPQQSNEGSGI